MMQIMCSRNIRCVCDGSCDDPGCIAKHPPQVVINCGNCERLARENAELQQSLDRLHGIRFSDRAHAALKSRAERAESELVGAGREIEYQIKERRKVEAELAALRKRVDDAPVGEYAFYAFSDYDNRTDITYSFRGEIRPRAMALREKRVRLVEESV